MKRNIYVCFVGCVISLFLTNCRKNILVDPPVDRLTNENVFNSDQTAIAALTGIYTRFSTDYQFFTLSKWAGLSADELNLWSGASEVEMAYYQNALFSLQSGAASNNAGTELWTNSYRYLYQCNQAIEGLTKSNALSTHVKQILLGEAKYFRAFLYFYLVNLYGEVPLVLTTDPEINRQIARTDETSIYNQIINDLQEAKTLLPVNFLSSDLRSATNERVRPTRWAAMALLARVFLYRKDYTNAEQQATEVINQISIFDVPAVSLSEAFLKNSKEAIWQIQPVGSGQNTLDAQLFVLSDPPGGLSPSKTVYLSQPILNDFEPGDNRLNQWVGHYEDPVSSDTFYFPYKYKKGAYDPTVNSAGDMSEYQMVLRLGEQYLIRAEVRARLGNVSGAIADLNVIRTRARANPTVIVPNPLPDLSSSLTQSQAIDAVMQERKTELFTEWGHRWLDLKRTGRINEVMSVITPLKGGVWQPTDQLYPLAIDDIIRNKNLQQNPGY